MVETMSKFDADLPRNERVNAQDADLVKRRLDCAVIEYLHVTREENEGTSFACVRGSFFEGGPLYPGAGITAKAHIQWCVRHPARNIRGYFVPLPGWEDLE
jgi:hypothetical protein